MKLHFLLILALVSGLMFGLVSAAWGNTRAIGMGGAFTAVADDGSAPFWNPAGIVQIETVAFTETRLAAGNVPFVMDLLEGNTNGYAVFEGKSFGMAGFTTKKFALNQFDEYNGSSHYEMGNWHGNAEGFRYYMWTTAGVYQGLAIGFNLKMVDLEFKSIEKIGVIEKVFSAYGSVITGDLGVLYQTLGDLKIGLTARNFFGEIYWKDVKMIDGGVPMNPPPPSKDVPQSYVLGLAYHPRQSLLMAVDLEMQEAFNNNKETRVLHVGLERAGLWNFVTLRLGGFTSFDKPPVISAGLGLKWGPANLDLAFVAIEESKEFELTAELRF